MKAIKSLSLAIAIASLGWASIGVAQSPAKLTVVVEGISRQKGQVCFRVYDKEQGFPQSAAGVVESGCTNVTAATIATEFYGLKPGTYAVTIFHDENEDQKLNTNFLGIPREGFGISNNPPIKIGAPKFKSASFSVVGDTTIRVTMRYL